VVEVVVIQVAQADRVAVHLEDQVLQVVADQAFRVLQDQLSRDIQVPHHLAEMDHLVGVVRVAAVLAVLV
jgi:hypothetical protein